MHILKNILKIPFWADYLREDRWIEKKLGKINDPDVDLRKEEQYLQKKMLDYCKKAFPEYYKAKGLTGEEALESFPLLSKSDMREHPEWFRSKYSRWIVEQSISTSGSTEEPFGFRISPNHDPVHQCMLWRLMGYQEGDRILKINGVQLPEENVKKNIFYQEVSSAQLPYGGSLLSALYLSDETAIYYYQYLEQLQPSFIRGYPYTLYRLAKYAQKYGWQFSFRLKGIQLTSEMIFDYQIEAIEKVFQTKVYMQYGHAEACVFAYTRDEDRKYYCSPLYGHVEVLDKNGKHVKSGEVGEAVVTSYSNYAMPFIRYRTGDMVEYGGNTGGVVILNKVIGRAQNVIYDKHGEDISLVCFVTKGAYHHILKWRVIQKEYGKVIIKIVKGTDYTKEDEEEFREIYQRQGGIEVEFQYVNDIEPSKNGKAVLLEQYLER